MHELALQAIADANDGTRASGTPGYDQSADYVAGLLEDAGFSVERQVFQFTIFEELSSSLSVDGSPAETQSFQYSPSGSVTDGNVIAVDLSLGLGNTSTSGCDASDFDGLDFSGGDDIALLQRGECSFAVKALNAQDAGAEAVIIFNQGNTEDRTGPVNGTLGEDAVGIVTIPVLEADYATGVAIDAGATVGLSTETVIDTRTTQNVIADLAGNNPDNVVMAGAHLLDEEAPASTTTAAGPLRCSRLRWRSEATTSSRRRTRCASLGGVPRSPG